MATVQASPRKSRLRVTVATLGLLGYGFIVALVTLTPKPVDAGFERNVSQLLDMLHRRGLPEWFGFGALEWSANVAMFIPLGLFITLVLPQRRQWIALVLLPLLSIAIETTQYFFLPGRFATLADVAANSLGGAVGFLFAVLLRALVHRRDAIRSGARP